MRLKTATLFVVVGTCYIFIAGTLGILIPDLFTNLRIAQTNTVLHALFSLAALLFFVLFYKDFIQKDETSLKRGARLAIAGIGLLFLLHLKGLLLAFDATAFPYLLHPHFIEPILPWMSSVSILLFFILFYRTTTGKDRSQLRTAILSAVIGSSVSALLRTVTLFLYVRSGGVRWAADLARKAPAVVLPVSTIGFIFTLYFFVSFYEQLNVNEKG